MNVRAATPWDALLRAEPRRCDAPAPVDADAAKASTKLAGLLDLLREHDASPTLTLALCSDLTPRQVWGLLKQPRAIGQVCFEDGRWSLCKNFPGRDVQRAIELLRSKGYQVRLKE